MGKLNKDYKNNSKDLIQKPPKPSRISQSLENIEKISLKASARDLVFLLHNRKESLVL